MKSSEKSKIIPIILSADNNYAMPMSVTMVSILENKKPDTSYHFYILVPSRFSPVNLCKIKSFELKYKNIKITFIDMKNTFKGAHRGIPHVSNPTYYRLMSAKLLPEKYKKAVYLDVDIVVNTDLSDFFNIEIGDYLVGGVLHPVYYFESQTQPGFGKEVIEKTGMPDFSQYINAGVLLMNLEKIRNENYTEIFCELVKKNLPTVDQDVLNSACYSKILHIPFKYNVMPKSKPYLTHEKLSEIYSRTEFVDAFENPAIIHWASPEKPWNNKNILFAQTWLKYYTLSPVKQKINVLPVIRDFIKTELRFRGVKFER